MRDSPSPVLVVTPDATIRMTCRNWLREEGWDVLEATSAVEALACHRRKTIPLTISEARLPGFDGIELLDRIHQLNADAEVVLLANAQPVELAVAAMKAGAADFLAKPIERPRLVDIARSTLCRGDGRDLSARRHRLMADFDFSGIVAHSESMIRTLELVTEVAALDCPVLITGPSGAGKEILARAVHRNSARAKQPFVTVNCAAVPDDLLERELFGHRRGGTASDVANKTGRLEEATSGSVLLDEIAEIAPTVQRRLLDFLESGTSRPLGSTHMRRPDVRILATTNVSLEDRVQDGSFREDLYYRLCVFPLYAAPLNQRREDIIPLARHALARLGARIDRPAPQLSREARRYLTTQSWRGNVRQLQNAVVRAVIVNKGNLLGSADFRALEPVATGTCASTTSDLWTLPEDGINLEALARSLTIQALDRTGLKVSPAARLLGISRATLRYRIKKYGLDIPVALSKTGTR